MQNSLKRGLTSLIAASLGLMAGISQASELRWFDIEVIIFKRNLDAASTDEHWPQPQQLSITTSHPLLAPLFDCGSEDCIAPRFDKLPVKIDGRGWPVTGPTHRRMLRANQLELGAQFNKLEQHAGFTPLLHLGWREVVAPRNRAQHYQIQAGLDYANDFNHFGLPHGIEPELFATDRLDNIDEPVDNAFEQFDLDSDTSSLNDLSNFNGEPSQAAALWELEGGIKVYLQHYLYIESQLLLKAPAEIEREITRTETLDPSQNFAFDDSEEPSVLLGQEATEQPSLIREIETQQQLQSYLFDQKRRVRSGEIHYFDHPLMGMLIQIRRSPEKAAQPAAPTQSTEAETTEPAKTNSNEAD